VTRRLRAVLGSLWTILLVAAALRIWFAWDYQQHLPHRALSAIPFLFESGNIAASIATGHGFGSPFRVDTGPTAWMTPLYPFLLAFVMRIFGVYTFQSWVAAISMNIGFSILACAPLYFAAKRVGGLGLAAIAGWLWAIFPNAIQLSYQSLWDTSLSALLGISAVWSTLRASDSRRDFDWWLCGLIWGLALMSNAALLSLLPLMLGWAIWRSRDFRRGALAAAMVVLCCIPWTVRNYRVFHAFVPLRSVLGLQLWVGNNADAKVVWLGEQHPIHDAAERDKYVQEGEIVYMKEKRDAALQYISTHLFGADGHERELIAGRFLMVWAGGSPQPVADFVHIKSAWFRYVLLFNLCAAISAAIGIILLFVARNPYAFPIAVGPIVFPFAYYFTLSLPRYRHPIDPTLMLLLALCICALVRRIGLPYGHARSMASTGRGRSRRR
jgi:hypothetical protein